VVPSVLERVTRSRPDLDGVMEAERDRDPVLSARLCRAAASSERYRRLRPFSASRGCDFTFLFRLYAKYSHIRQRIAVELCTEGA